MKKIQTKTIYKENVAFLLDGLLDGYNASILAYGPTGCGKTFTYWSFYFRMIGTNDHPGIMPLAMLELLTRVNQEKKTKEVMIKASYIEIYNENIKDLLISEGIIELM